MKSYYHAHESAYQQIKSKGYVGWGNAKSLAELGDERTQAYLTASIAKWLPESTGKKALDMGCGSGTTAFTLAKLGLHVSGIDISSTAIEMACELAAALDLKIQFQVGDVLQLEDLNEKFDLIYDSHCLHCIVFDEDRRRVLDGVKNSLNNSGIFILDTMVATKGINPVKGVDTLRFDDDYILWHKTKESSDRGIVEVDGQHWCAQRRIYPAEKIMNEVLESGFKVISKYVDQQDEGHPWMLRLILG